MKYTLFYTLAMLALVSSEQYTTENDDLDIEAVVNSDQLKLFANCFNRDSDCNDVTNGFKKDLPEAVQQSCAKCTPAQKHILRRFLEGIKEKLPTDYEALKAKYDPEGKHFAALETAIAKA